MILAHPVRTLVLALAAATLVVVPLASPLLVSVSLILGGVLAAGRGATDLALPLRPRGVILHHAA